MNTAPSMTLVRTESGDLQLQFSDALLALGSDDYEEFLLDAKRTIESALLDVQPNMTSEAGWQPND